MSNAQFDQSTSKDNSSIRLNDINEDEEVASEMNVQGEEMLQASPFEKPRPPKLTSQISTKIKKATKELKRVATIAQQGPKKLDRTTSMTAGALRSLQFVNKKVGSDGWAEVEDKFGKIAVDGLLLRSEFGKCIGMKEKEFAGELFDALARRRGIKEAKINKAQLRDFWEQLSGQSFEARIQTFFDMLDKNADGKVTEEEVKQIIIVSACANQLWKVKEKADEFAELIMKALDPDAIGYIQLHNLETLFLQAPKGADNEKLNKFLSKKIVVTKEKSPIKGAVKKIKYLFENNWKRIWFMLLWLAICAALFTWKFLQYKHRYVYHVMGGCVATAKGAAETLKFNMALILLPVCRKTVTWLRSRTKLGVAVPFDDNINFHQVVAFGIAIGVAMHAISHLTCDFPRLLHSSEPAYAPLGKYFGPMKPHNYYWFIKGTEGWTGITMVILMVIAYILAQPWFRKNNMVKLPKVVKSLTGFNAFWYSHHLFVIVYALLFVHGWFLYLSKDWYKKTTWMYISVPILLYTCERMIKALQYTSEKVHDLKFVVYRENEASSTSAGNALSLQMAKPEGFTYSSGQYIFVKCLDVSPFEWHPFSLTSAPEDDYISVHIRDLGDWTKQLISLFSKLPQTPGHSGILCADTSHGSQVPRMPRIKIDGPNGAPAQDYKNYDVLLLVGLGIGATPLISIVKDVLYHIKQQNDIENGIVDNTKKGHTNHTNSRSSSSKGRPIRVKRAYFNWVTKEQGSFDWFKRVMNEVAEIDHDHVIEMHNYCSSVHKEGDARSALFTLLQSLEDAKNGLDIVSGTRVRTHFGRADWNSVFSHVADNHPHKRVGVFYCGQTSLIKELRHLCRYFSTTTNAKFEFHKENF